MGTATRIAQRTSEYLFPAISKQTRWKCRPHPFDELSDIVTAIRCDIEREGHYLRGTDQIFDALPPGTASKIPKT
jgi:hypothetical protein